MRNTLARLLDAIFGPRCRYGCGQRVFDRDVAAHEHVDHGGDPA